VKFVFATTDVQKVPTTIISRCQRFDLKRITTPLIRDHLLMIAGKENVALSTEAAETVARGAEGGLRDAESMLDQLVAFCGDKIEEEDVLSVFGFTARQAVAELCEHLIAGDTAAALRAIHAQAEAGKDLSRLMSDLIEHLRNLLVAQSAAEGLQDELSAEAVAALADQAARIAPDKLLSLIEQFGDAEGRMKWAANKKMHFEIAAIRAIQTLSQATLTEVLDTLTALRGGTPRPPKPTAPKVTPSVAPPVAKKVEVAAPAPAPKTSLSATVSASLVESKAPIPAPPVTTKVREEPAPTPVPKPQATAPAVSAEELWPQFVARLRQDKNRGLVSNFVESGKIVEVINGVAILAFPPDADLARQSCEGKNRAHLESVLSELANQPLTLKCEKRGGLVIEKMAREEVKPETPADPMEAFKNDPLIQKALDVFKAEILPA
jgi:DNA polymerase-3 subunit gamma/tau